MGKIKYWFPILKVELQYWFLAVMERHTLGPNAPYFIILLYSNARGFYEVLAPSGLIRLSAMCL
jgi:hypothetical protein